jgi:tetratricopeptide (TPR) repeat protein
MGSNRFLAPRESYPKALAAARKALALDEELAEAHATMASALTEYEWDWPGAERAFNRALELNPGYATAHHFRALFLSAMGRHDEAVVAMRKARSLDPMSPRINANVGLVLHFARRHEHATRDLQESLELFPDNTAAHMYLGGSFSAMGLHREAIVQGRLVASLEPDYPPSSLLLAYVYARADRHEEARNIISTIARTDRTYHVDAGSLAMAYASMGDTDLAFAWLEKGYAERSSHMPYLATDPFWDPLRDDPRFEELLRRLKLPPQQAGPRSSVLPEH